MVNQRADDRIPVRFGRPEAGEAVLIEGDAQVAPDRPVARFRLAPGLAGHVSGCPCCVPRGPVAEALGRLFLARARGEVAWFHSIAVHRDTRRRGGGAGCAGRGSSRGGKVPVGGVSVAPVFLA